MNDIPRYKLLAQDIVYIKNSVKEIKEKLDREYITRKEFDLEIGPIRRFFWGLIGVITIGLAGATVAFVFRMVTK
uniref:Tetrahydromethanopterin S-methyltransferase n=1 Tax=viral metagenome TaxID=1070528 RepID=A0A6M3JPB2_9ZZZZ